jgi:hypothetical protein
VQIALRANRLLKSNMLVLIVFEFSSLFEQNAYLLDPGLFESAF